MHKLCLSDDTERKNILATKMQPTLEKIGNLTKGGFWNKGFFTSYATPFYNYGVKGYIDENYIRSKSGLNLNDKDFKIVKILCFEKICSAIFQEEKSEKSLHCLLEFAKVYPETISAVKAIMFCHPENCSNFAVLEQAVNYIDENLSSDHQNHQATFLLDFTKIDQFYIDELAEQTDIIMIKEMSSQEL